MDFQVPQGVMPQGRGFGSGWGSRGQLAKNPSTPGGAAGSSGGTTQNSSAPASPFQAPNPIEDPLAPGGGQQQPESSTAPAIPPPAAPPFSPPMGPSGHGGHGGGSSFHPNWAFSPRMWAGSGQPNPQDIGKTFGSEIFQPLATGPHASIPPPGGTPAPPTQGQPAMPSWGNDFISKTLGGMAGSLGFSAPFQATGEAQAPAMDVKMGRPAMNVQMGKYG